MKVLLTLLLISNISYAAIGDYDNEFDCTWKYNGCMRDNRYIIDLRTQAQKDLDKINYHSPDEYLLNSPQIYTAKKVNEFEGKTYFIPLGLTDTEKIAALATASLGLIAFKNDQELMDLVQNNKTHITKKIEDFGYYVGGTGNIHLAAGSYFLGAIFKNGKLKDVGLLTVATGIVSQTITEAFKVSFGRRRPRNANGNPYIFGTDSKSFFSGHASGAFGTAAVLAEVYKGTAVPYAAYGVAGLVAYARMHAEGHYASDVIFGALAGVLSAKLTMRFLNGDDSNGGLLITPGVYTDPLSKESYYMLNFKWTPESPKDKISCEEFKDLPSRERIRYCLDKVFALSYEN